MKSTFSLLVILIIPLSIFAQCADDLKSIGGSMGYKNRGQYCEGFYRSLVSSTDLQMVHFTKGKLSYSSTEAETLQLSIPVSTNQEIKVRGMGIPRNLFYRFDATLGMGEKFEWKTGTILLKNAQTKYARLLGLHGFTESNGDKIYFPVQVGDANKQAAYQIKFVASGLVQQVKWKIDGQTDFELLKNGGSFSSGRAITIALPVDLPSGQYKLLLLGKEKDGITPVSSSITFKI